MHRILFWTFLLASIAFRQATEVKFTIPANQLISKPDTISFYCAPSVVKGQINVLDSLMRKGESVQMCCMCVQQTGEVHHEVLGDWVL